MTEFVLCGRMIQTRDSQLGNGLYLFRKERGKESQEGSTRVSLWSRVMDQRMA